MTESGRQHRHMGAWGRFILGVSVLAWLNVAAQPCLMAMELKPDASVEAQAASGHADHARDHAVTSDCDHCPPLAGHHDQLCATSSASDCGVTPDYNADARHAKLKLKDLGQALILPELPISPAPERSTSDPPLVDYEQLKFRGGPSLNIRYCVYLK